MRYLILLIFCIPIFTYGQVDSLMNTLNGKSSKEKIESLIDYMRQEFSSRPQNALKAAERGLDIAYQTKDSLNIVKVLYAKAFVLRTMSSEKTALTVLNEAYDIAKRNKYIEQLIKIINLQALIYTYTAQYDLALKLHFEALEINEEYDYKEDLSITCSNIGVVYYKLQNSTEALKYFKRSLELKKLIGSDFDLHRLYINIGLVYAADDNIEQAETHFKKGMELCNGDCPKDLYVSVVSGLGKVSVLKKDFKVAEEYFLEAYKVSVELKNVLFQIESLVRLADLNEIQKDYKSVVNKLQTAEKLASSSDYAQNRAIVYKKLAAVFSLTDDYKNSTIYSTKYSNLRDSLLSEELIKNLSDIQSKFAQRDNLNTIKDKERIIRAQSYLNIAIIIIFILSAGLVYLNMRNNRKIKELNAKLAQQVEIKTFELVNANKNLSLANDELDNLIYKTSHDIRGPLATLKGVCNVAIMHVKDPLSLKFLHKLDVSSTQLNLILDKFSRVNEIYNTNVIIEEVNVKEIVSQIIQSKMMISKPKSIDVKILCDVEAIIFSDRSVVYHALDNVMDNALKFYNESTRIESYVIIHIYRSENELFVSVKDNGIGVPVELSEQSIFKMFTRGTDKSLTGGLGLFISKIAARKIKGDIKFKRPIDNSYTEFVFNFPLIIDASTIVKPKDRS